MAIHFQDYYRALEVARTASPEEIKLAFRRLARLYHPDVAKDKVAGEARFKEINEAYEVLGDPAKRRTYDELGPNGENAPGGPDGMGGGGGAGGMGGSGGGAWPGRAGGRGRGAPAGGDDFEFDGTGFSDFFESFFGSGRGGRGPSAEPGEPRADYGSEFSQPGRDVEADIMVPLEEALRGSKRKVTLRRSGGLSDLLPEGPARWGMRASALL